TLNLGRLDREQLAGDRTDAAVFVSGGDLHGVGTGVCVDVVQLQAARAGDGLRGAVAPVDVERETGGLIDRRGIAGRQRERARLAADAVAGAGDSCGRRHVVDGDGEGFRIAEGR